MILVLPVSIGLMLELFFENPPRIVLSTWILLKGMRSPMLNGLKWKIMTGLDLDVSTRLGLT